MARPADFTVGDINKGIVVTYDESLTGKTVQFKILKPDATSATVSAAISGTDGKTATHTISASTLLSVAGNYTLELVNVTDGNRSKDVAVFNVREKVVA